MTVGGSGQEANDVDGHTTRVNRRVVLGTAGAIGLTALGLGAAAQPSLFQSATPVADALATPGSATPVAAASPAATPMATPLPPPPLEIVRDQAPVYQSTPVPGGHLRLVRPPAERLDFNPTSFRQDYQVLVSYLDPLLRPDPVTLEPTPWLAEAWEVSADGLEFRVHLRPGVTWHDGTPFTADDVEFSLLAYRDDYDSGVRNFFALMDAVEAIDELEIRVNLSLPDPSWLFNAASQLIFQAAQYRDYWSQRPPGERSLTGFDALASLPVGTGPWRLASITDDGVAFDRNQDYWREPAWFDQLSIRWEADRRQRIEDWRDGTADLLWPLRTEDIPLVEDVPARLYVAESASVMFAAFNFANPTGLPRFFDDLRLREALNLAVNRERYADEVFREFIRAEAAGTIAQPWAHSAGVRAPQHDPGAARDLLVEAGWADANGDGIVENGAGVPFDLTAIVREDARRELIQVLRLVKEDWADVGVALRIQILPADQFQERALRGHDFDVIAYAYDLFPGFTDFDLYGSAWDIRTNPQGWNPGGYANPAADQAIADYLAATDVETQRAALYDLQAAVNDDLFGIWLGFPADLVLSAIDIDGFQPNKVWQTADTRLLWRTNRRRGIERD